MKVAFLFPGQGAKGVLAALGVTAESARGRELLDYAAAGSGVPVARLFERGGRELERTEVLQPVLTAIALFVGGELRAAGCTPLAVAGHSLGEIAAAAAAGWLAAKDAIAIAALRGALMAREAARSPGGLLALQSGAEEVVREALAVGRASGVIGLGAVNAPDEVVLTGDRAALRAVAVAFPSRRVPVAGAWHSEAMAGAVRELRDALRGALRARRWAVAPGGPTIALVCNRDGSLIAREEVLADCLATQIARPVQWTRVLRALEGLGVTDYVTVGPGAVLRGLLYKNLKGLGEGEGETRRVHSAEDARDIARAIASLTKSESSDRNSKEPVEV